MAFPSYLLKRHPLRIKAFFENSLVLTYALPVPCLQPLLPPGLTVDEFKGLGFVAIALVQTRGLRPFFLPKFLGKDFFLAGYRIFARYQTKEGRNLRGLRILRSYTDKATMVRFGNLLTHYNYCQARVKIIETSNGLEIDLQTPNQEADLHLKAELTAQPVGLPEKSPFKEIKEARKFAGPLPFTFDYEPQTHSIIRIEGVRKDWNPKPVQVEVFSNQFFNLKSFQGETPILANAFYVKNIPYQWKRGIRERLSSNG